MRFGIFYELQLPRPWGADSEAQLLRESLEQVDLADRLGFDYVWAVEHHFLEEYSHSSAPEVFLAAASQRTERIRLGHGIVNVMPAVNHPARIAERIATLDLVSGGRVEFGTGESSSAAELGGFLVEREHKREIWHEAVDAVTRMLVEEPFAGFDGEFIQMPPRNVVPKPQQRPHPPLWVACTRRETIQLAARAGIGALSFSFVEPEDARVWVDEYYGLLSSEECVPAGFAVNPAVAIVLPMMLAPDQVQAAERGADGAAFFSFALAHFYAGAEHRVGVSDVWRAFEAQRPASWLPGAIGTPAQVADLVRRYEAAGIDQITFILQAGRTRHEHICESLELFAAEVMPEFAERREERESAKAERLATAVEAALARREPPSVLSTPYVIDEQAELTAARRRQGPALPGRDDVLSAVVDGAQRVGRRGATQLLGRLVDGASDEQVEKRFSSPLALRALFAGMARSYVSDAVPEFEGRLLYELSRPETGQPPVRWTIRVHDERASAHQGADNGAQLKIRFTLADFVRLAAGAIDPAEPLLAGRASFDGDFALAAKLPEMFGAPSP
ncbi:MAG TPA: LLM class flavin-dependent oxidoreductase [Solirubrobacteraceae bacterium]|nr:LLM class flavin-dependent oxidoreductase [Solirubrobacteraceae bacterium]